MEHPFFTTPTEALRCLTMAEKLLAAHDLLGSKSFAMRAHHFDPNLSQADQILAVVDTLLAAEHRVANNQLDLYAVLRLTPPQGLDGRLIVDQYRRLLLLLNPQKNKFPFAEQAFRLVFDAYSVLSDPLRRSLYDKDLVFYSQQQQQQPNPFISHNFIFFGGGMVQQPVHGGQNGGVGGSNSPQVNHVQPQVEPVVGGSSQEPQNFTSGYNFAFGSGSGSGSKSGYEAVSNEAQRSYSTFGVGGNVDSTCRTTHEQFNNLQKHIFLNFSNVSDETIHNVNVSENVGEETETVEDEKDVGEETETVEDEKDVEEEEEERVVVGDGSSFWTTCPYCYYMYEYPSVYVDCTLKCQNCKRAFQAVVIPSPPPIVEGQEAYFCCWAFLPYGFSMEEWKKHSPMGNNVNEEGAGGARGSAPKVYADNNVDFVVISDSSESNEDWKDARDKYENHKVKNVKGKKAIVTCGSNAKKGKAANFQDDVVSPQGAELSKKPTSELSKMGLATNAGKKPGWDTKNFGKLDLNVELSIESEEPAMRTNQGNGSGPGEDDSIEGNGFFEGLDEYLNSLPILNVAGDNKVVKAA